MIDSLNWCLRKYFNCFRFRMTWIEFKMVLLLNLRINISSPQKFIVQRQRSECNKILIDNFGTSRESLIIHVTSNEYRRAHEEIPT